MDAPSILQYGHLTVLRTIENLPDSEWETPNVCGVWSSKQIIAHLASFEHMLHDVLHLIQGAEMGPTLLRYAEKGISFNDVEVADRQDKTAVEVLQEYSERHEHNVSLLTVMPVDISPKTGTMPWYGSEYSLDDYLVYSFYGHKREHTAQINVFKDLLGV